MGNLSQKSPAAISLIGRIGAALRWQAQSRSAGGSHASRIPRYAPRPYRTRFRWPPPQRLGLKTKAPCLRTGPLFLIQWWRRRESAISNHRSFKSLIRLAFSTAANSPCNPDWGVWLWLLLLNFLVCRVASLAARNFFDHSR